MSNYGLDDDVMSLSSSSSSMQQPPPRVSSKGRLTKTPSSMIESYEYDLNNDSNEEDEIYSVSSSDENAQEDELMHVRPSSGKTMTGGGGSMGYSSSNHRISRRNSSNGNSRSSSASRQMEQVDRFKQEDEEALMKMMNSSLMSNNSSVNGLEEISGSRGQYRPDVNNMGRKYSSPSPYRGDDGDFGHDQDRVMTMDALAQKELHLRQLNEAINAESKHVLQQAAHIVKQQEKKLEEISSRPSSAANSVGSRPQSAKLVPKSARPASGQPQASGAHAVKAIIDEGNNIPDTDLDVVAEQMGLEAAMKFYKARVKVLERDLTEMTQKFKQADELSRQGENKLKDFTVENKRLEKLVFQNQQKHDKQKKELDTLQEKYKNSVAQINEMRKEVEALKREQQTKDVGRVNSTDTKGKDVRLNRALEEIEKYKAQLSKIQKERGDAGDSIRRECEKYRQENKKLERQKQDLVVAFKKQMKLIDILKRQKIHIEAARLLNFTEKEFAETIDWK